LIDELDFAVRPFFEAFSLDQLRVTGVVFKMQDFHLNILGCAEWLLISRDNCQ
jgi:hypothetical protein